MTWKFGCRHLANTVKSPAAQIVVIFKRGVVVFALKSREKKGTQFVHLNGSGLAVGRTMAAGKLSTTGSDS